MNGTITIKERPLGHVFMFVFKKLFLKLKKIKLHFNILLVVYKKKFKKKPSSSLICKGAGLEITTLQACIENVGCAPNG